MTGRLHLYLEIPRAHVDIWLIGRGRLELSGELWECCLYCCLCGNLRIKTYLLSNRIKPCEPTVPHPRFILLMPRLPITALATQTPVFVQIVGLIAATLEARARVGAQTCIVVVFRNERG